MKKIKLLILLLFLSSAISFAQEKKYISYKVKRGETIRSIAKNYSLSTRDLLRLNPDVSRRPAPNTIIIVPNKNYGKHVHVIETIKTNDSLYTVYPKETLFGISKKFGITIEELEVANPELSNGLKIGMKLVIPKPSATTAEDSINYVLHSVVIDDTIYNLTKRYKVTAEDLLSLNPTLNEGLKLGMLLKIKPINYVLHSVVIDDTIYNLTKRYKVTEEGLLSLNPTLNEGLKLGMLLKIKPIESVEEEVGFFNEKIDFSKRLNVVLMLPYQLNELTDSITTKNFNQSNSLLNYTTDFHLGAQMAIDSLRQKGLIINVTYLDTENSDFKLQYLVNKNDFSTTDVVIGPLYFENAHWVSKHIKAPVVSPLYSKKQTELSADNLVKSSPNFDLYENKLLSYLEKTYNGENIIVINDEKQENQPKFWRIVNKLKAFNSIKKITVIKPENGFINSEIFKNKLDISSKNWVVILSDESLTVSAAVNNLKSFVEDVDIRLFALNKGKNFDNIENNFLGKLNFMFPTSEFLNVTDVKVQRFYKKYQSENYALPSKHAIRGFDVTYDALVRIACNENLEEGLKAGKSSRISSVFDYDKKMFGSFENRGVFLIQYTKDLNTIILE